MTNHKTEEVAVEDIENSPVEAEEEITGKALDVFDKGGGFIRTFSVDIHGGAYKKLAEGFAEKIGGTVKKH